MGSLFLDFHRDWISGVGEISLIRSPFLNPNSYVKISSFICYMTNTHLTTKMNWANYPTRTSKKGRKRTRKEENWPVRQNKTIKNKQKRRRNYRNSQGVGMLYISFQSFHRFPERRHMRVLLLPHFSTLFLEVLRRNTKKSWRRGWWKRVGFRFSLVGEENWRRSLDLEELTEEILKRGRERETEIGRRLAW